MNSDYAEADRADKNSVSKDFKSLSENQIITELLDSLPYIAAILNKERQILFCNKVLMTEIGQLCFEQIIGNRPGEVFKCENASKNPGGCGTSKNCRYCGAVNAILQSQKEKKKVTYECRITSNTNGEHKPFDLLVTAAPMFNESNNYTLLTVNDISDIKRRRILEQIFFHDIVNKIGSLNGFFELIHDLDDQEKIRYFLNIASGISHDLTEEILAQKDLLAAENDELKTRYKIISVKQAVNICSLQIQNHTIAKQKVVQVLPNKNDYEVETDLTLLKRIITNMLKNALEAIDDGETVEIGYQEDVKNVLIFVKNASYIPEDIQSQIFKRSFSTKGNDRGLGTYSMKLLGEKYLKGKVSYTTNKHMGTTFYISLPINS